MYNRSYLQAKALLFNIQFSPDFDHDLQLFSILLASSSFLAGETQVDILTHESSKPLPTDRLEYLKLFLLYKNEQFQTIIHTESDDFPSRAVAVASAIKARDHENIKTALCKLQKVITNQQEKILYDHLIILASLLLNQSLELDQSMMVIAALCFDWLIDL
jgi:hypothetical protein